MGWKKKKSSQLVDAAPQTEPEGKTGKDRSLKDQVRSMEQPRPPWTDLHLNDQQNHNMRASRDLCPEPSQEKKKKWRFFFQKKTETEQTKVEKMDGDKEEKEQKEETAEKKKRFFFQKKTEQTKVERMEGDEEEKEQKKRCFFQKKCHWTGKWMDLLSVLYRFSFRVCSCVFWLLLLPVVGLWALGLLSNFVVLALCQISLLVFGLYNLSIVQWK